MIDPRSYFVDNASDYASVFQQSLVNHPTAKQFVVVPGRTEKTYNFVPTHLKRLLPNNCSEILTVNRPTGTSTTEDLKTYLGTVALLTLADQSKAESLTQAIHRATEETILRTVFKDVVDLLEKAEKEAPGAVRSAKPYDDYHRHTIELMRLEHEIAFEAKCQQEMEKEMDLIEEKLMRALDQMNRTMSDIKNIAEDEENEKEEDDA